MSKMPALFSNAATSTNTVDTYKALLRTITVLGFFSLVVLSLLLFNNHQIGATDPRYSRELKAIKQQLHSNPTSEALKADVRDLDTSMRKVYLRRLDFANTGSYLLLIGLTGLLITIPAAAQYKKKLVFPTKDVDQTAELRRSSIYARNGVIVIGILLTSGFIVLAVITNNKLTDGYARAVNEYRKHPPTSFTQPGSEAPVSSAAANTSAQPALPAPGAAATSASEPLTIPALPALPSVTPDGATPGSTNTPKPNSVSTQTVTTPKLAVEAGFDSNDYSPTLEEYNSNWPVFRGPSSGIASGTYPSSWNVTTGASILWKTPVPLPGWNSPVVWKDRVFIAGANKEKRAIYCYNATDGKMMWNALIESSVGTTAPQVFDDTGYAAPTMAVDGKRVFAIFPNGDVVCYSFEGNLLWKRGLGTPDSMYGYAASLVTYRSLVIIQYDQGSGSDGKSAIMALQGATGKVVWITERPVANSWSSPIVVNNGDTAMVITSANPWTIAYDAQTGKEIWRASVMSGDVAPSPAYANGIAYVCNTGAVLAAIRVNGSGDVTKSHVIWQIADGLPDITSPATNGEFLVTLMTDGTATCFDAKQGKKLWDHSFKTPFRSSPVIIGSKVYLLDSDGMMHIIDLKQSFDEVGQSSISEKIHATPAFANNRIYFRGENNLICVGNK